MEIICRAEFRSDGTHVRHSPPIEISVDEFVVVMCERLCYQTAIIVNDEPNDTTDILVGHKMAPDYTVTGSISELLALSALLSKAIQYNHENPDAFRRMSRNALKVIVSELGLDTMSSRDEILAAVKKHCFPNKP